MPDLWKTIRDQEARIVDLERERDKLWRYVKRTSRAMTRVTYRLPEGRQYERGSRLRIPKRPTQMLRNAGLIPD